MPCEQLKKALEGAVIQLAKAGQAYWAACVEHVPSGLQLCALRQSLFGTGGLDRGDVAHAAGPAEPFGPAGRPQQCRHLDRWRRCPARRRADKLGVR